MPSKRNGICINFTGCSKARSNLTLVTSTETFRCPECEQPLRTVSKSGGRLMLKSALVIGALVCVGFLIWYIGQSSQVSLPLQEGPSAGEEPPPPPLQDPPVQDPPVQDPPVQDPPEEEPFSPPPLPPPPRIQPVGEQVQRHDEASDLISRGQSLMARGQRDAARAAFAEAAELDPQNAFAWANLGAAEMLKGDAESARRAYSRALRADGDNWLAHYNLGVYFIRTGTNDVALDHLGRSLSQLRRAGTGRELNSVIHDLETNNVFSRIRHDSRFRSLLTRR